MATRESDYASSSSSSSSSESDDEQFNSQHDSFDDVRNERGSGNDTDDNDNFGLGSQFDFFSALDPLKSEPGSIVGDIQYSQEKITADATSFDHSTTSTTIHEPSLSSASIIPHRGSFRRLINPTSLNADPTAMPGGLSNQSQLTPSCWPMYAINVVVTTAEDSEEWLSPINSLQYGNNAHLQQKEECLNQSSYQIIFDRQQYEFCTRLFALLDTESESFIGPDCIREFVYLHYPVVRRRDDAIFKLRRGSNDNNNDDDEIQQQHERHSPTFDEIWDKTIRSDPRLNNTECESIHRIGIEGWMIFCRILALAHHQESQRRFASRHLQQMMRHKHGGGGTNNTRMNPNEVVVVVDNPPPGPPALISIHSLIEVELERMTSHSDECIPGWPFCPLPVPELDLDHYLVSTFKQSRLHNIQPRGRVSIEPFSSSKDGDFILRYDGGNGGRTIVRRSYSDFEWLDGILKLHKRPGQGHLCGRVLPPFPSKQGGFTKQHSTLSKKMTKPSGAVHQKDISERAMEVAKSGIGMISSIANSLWSGYVSTSTPSPSPASSLSATNKSGQSGVMSPQSVIAMKAAKRIERYLNYLLESDALSSSFPLNAILQASQSGLESSKLVLLDYTKQKKRLRSNMATATSRDKPQSAASIFSALVSKTSTSIMRLQGDDETSWLRAAANVAMALQFHGILETTGHETASAKIQHASLPKFVNRRGGSWDDEETGDDKGHKKRTSHGSIQSSDSPGSDANFEAGVINVESELADEDEEDIGGYDMLPSPGPSEVHRVLNAGSGSVVSDKVGSAFTYEARSEQLKCTYDREDAVLGSIKVENDIDKLREIIQSTSQKLEKLYLSSASVRSAQDARNIVQLNIIRDVDSWGDNGGDIITQRALVNGVASLEIINNNMEDIHKTIADDLSWQSSLSSSAVGAVLEVRDAVRASNTASRAKSAAYIAADRAKKAYESCDHSSSMEKVQSAQLEASNAQSHAIHATVVEYEANLAKKRSAVSFAQDVQSWNIHRKKELLRTCVQAAKSQQEACRKAADALEGIRDGLIDSSGYSLAEAEVTPWSEMKFTSASHSRLPSTDQLNADRQVTASTAILQTQVGTSNADDFTQSNSSSLNERPPSTDQLNVNSQVTTTTAILQTQVGTSNADDFTRSNSSSLNDWNTRTQVFNDNDIIGASNSIASDSDGFNLLKDTIPSSDDFAPQLSLLDEDYFSWSHHEQSIIAGDDNSDNDETEPNNVNEYSYQSQHDSTSDIVPTIDTMTTSMQNLIDGLLLWGGEDVQGNDDEVHEAEETINNRSSGSDAHFDDLLG